MKKISLTILSVAVLFLFSCEDKNHENHEHNGATEVHNHDDHEGHDHSEAKHEEHQEESKLELNNGKKWKMSASLMAAATAMSEEVNNFAKSGGSDYHALAGKLNDGISKLINKCELPDGVAHENLHEWLHPYMGLVKELENSSNDKEGKEVFEKIQQSFKTYNQYFE